MALEGKVISADSNPCPAGRKGIVTAKVYENGEIEYECSSGTTGLGMDLGYCICPAGSSTEKIATSCQVG